MARAHSTEPAPAFPAGVDREAFGHWLSGFTDGEGCFYLCYQIDRKGIANFKTRFKIELRADDIGCLRSIQSFLACGTVYLVKPQPPRKQTASFRVDRIADLAAFVVPHFERYPLRAKKASDFPIWREGIRLVHQVSLRAIRSLGYGRGTRSRWEPHEIQQFREIETALREQRAFR